MITETRRAPRRQIAELVPVMDQMTETSIGRLGNVSESGMLLIASVPLTDDALYQLSFPISDRNGRTVQIDVGAHLLWNEAAHAPGQSWAGVRFLTLSSEHRELLRRWIEAGLSPA
ncbi:MAG: PilZ domain-containing protein [Stenotrophomonas sp.]